jgi:membrane-bound serine protease (ClpP class)
MRRRGSLLIAISLFWFCAAEVAGSGLAPLAAPADETIRSCAGIRLTASINPGTSEFIQSSIDRAYAESMGCLILQLDTPGGLLQSTRDIVQKLLRAPLPVVVYVAPPGAHAGSAGAFITLAAHIAAMAPGTNIGAAHPVSIGGGGQMDKETAKNLSKKAEEDAAAFIRSIARVRGRNVQWAEKAVRESRALSAEEAVRDHVVDFVADDLADLLRKMDGRTVDVLGRTKTLRTQGVAVSWYDMSIKERLVNFFADPNIAYLLMMLGMIGILGEVFHPGAIFPGVIGAICLLLAFMSFQVLPINYAGVFLIVLAIGLFVAEIFATSYGVLALGGIFCLVVGSVILIDPGAKGGGITFDKEFQLSPWAVAPSAVLLGAFFLYAAFVIVRAQRSRTTTGKEGLIGERGQTLEYVGPLGGRVFVHGESWNAYSDERIEAGEPVEVVAVEGLKLKVVRRKSE